MQSNYTFIWVRKAGEFRGFFFLVNQIDHWEMFSLCGPEVFLHTVRFIFAGVDGITSSVLLLEHPAHHLGFPLLLCEKNQLHH